MAAYVKQKRWNQWAGERSDLLEAIAVARDTLAKWQAGDEAKPPPVFVSIRIEDLTIEGDESEVENLPSRDLVDVRRISIRVGDYIASSRVSIEVTTTAPAVAVEIHGDDRVGVEGLSSSLFTIFARGARRFGWYSSQNAAGVGGLAVFGCITLGVLLPRALGFAANDHRWQTGEVVGLALGVAAGIATFAGLGVLFPDLELLDVGGRTLYRRWRAAAMSALTAVILGVVASAVWAAAHG